MELDSRGPHGEGARADSTSQLERAAEQRNNSNEILDETVINRPSLPNVGTQPSDAAEPIPLLSPTTIAHSDAFESEDAPERDDEAANASESLSHDAARQALAWGGMSSDEDEEGEFLDPDYSPDFSLDDDLVADIGLAQNVVIRLAAEEDIDSDDDSHQEAPNNLVSGLLGRIGLRAMLRGGMNRAPRRNVDFPKVTSQPVPFLRNALSHELRQHVTPVATNPRSLQLFSQPTSAAPLTLNDLNQPLDRLGISSSNRRGSDEDSESPGSGPRGGGGFTLLRRSDRSRPGQPRGSARQAPVEDPDAVLLESQQLHARMQSYENVPMWMRRQKRIQQQRAAAQQSGSPCAGRRLSSAASKFVSGLSTSTRAAVAAARDRSLRGSRDGAGSSPRGDSATAAEGSGGGSGDGHGGAHSSSLVAALMATRQNDAELCAGDNSGAVLSEDARGGGSGAGVRRRSSLMRMRSSGSSRRESLRDGQAGTPTEAERLAMENDPVATGDSAGGSQQESGEPHSVPPRSNLACMLHSRESALQGADGWSASQTRHVCSMMYPPVHKVRQIEARPAKAYIGQYSHRGDLFVAAYQDSRVRVFDTSRADETVLVKDVEARRLRWTITDTAISRDSAFLLYSSISQYVHLVNLSGGAGPVHSIANITEVHEELDFLGGAGETSTGIWSLAWSPTASEVAAGTSQPGVIVHDLAACRTVLAALCHHDDVNAVTYADPSGNIIVSGSDDTRIFVHDRRTIQEAVTAPEGQLLGHTEGVTHVSARGDGIHLISNAKDSTVRMWDLRMMTPGSQSVPRSETRSLSYFDYRWQLYPQAGLATSRATDNSVMVFRGHKVLQTLIRAYWAPEHSTAGRCIYSGSADGSVYIYDTITGHVLHELKHHADIVRDCSWHPTRPQLMSVSWDGSIVEWGPRPNGFDFKPSLCVHDDW